MRFLNWKKETVSSEVNRTFNKNLCYSFSNVNFLGLWREYFFLSLKYEKSEPSFMCIG